MSEVSGLLRAALDRARELSNEAGENGGDSAELSILLFERRA